MPPCSECQRPFPTRQGMRDHRRKMHALHECGLCGKQGFSSGALLAHARAKHPKKFTKLFYSCKACDYYTPDGETLRLHYHTSPIHRKCPTCKEPYWDLPDVETLVMYKRPRRDLRRCDDCGRLTMSDMPASSAILDEEQRGASSESGGSSASGCSSAPDFSSASSAPGFSSGSSEERETSD